MTTETDTGDTTLSPDDAFAVLGNETRMDILRVLGQAAEPLSFTRVRDRVGIRQGAQFNYHLDKLVGHFVRKTEDGYELTSAGKRVIEAVLSGAITESPVLEPARTDVDCHHCGTPIKMSYRDEWVAMACTECAGTFGPSQASEIVPNELVDHGYLGGHEFPPAGVKGRTPTEVVQASRTWGMLEKWAVATGLCPRCSAPVDRELFVCEAHEVTNGLCGQCDARHEVTLHNTCTNCHHAQGGPLAHKLLADPDVLAFLTTHGLDPLRLSPEVVRMVQECEEDVLSREPFEARFTFSLDGDQLTVTVDEDLSVTDVIENRASDFH